MIRSLSELEDYSTIQDQTQTNNNTTITTTPRITTLADPKIQQAAFGPLTMTASDSTKNFAEKKILEQRHYARCRIPVDVARILKSTPELITRACEAFYTRDTLAMATCSRMTKFLPASTSGPAASESRKNVPFVTTAVCFTKTCYAQLMGQQFQPPKSWDGVVPPLGVDDPKLIKEAELGMKLVSMLLELRPLFSPRTLDRLTILPTFDSHRHAGSKSCAVRIILVTLDTRAERRSTWR